MSLTNTEYTDLFTCIGKFAKAINQFQNMAGGYSSPVPNLKTLFDTDLAPTLTAKGRYDALDGLLVEFEGFKDAGVGWGSALGNYITTLLTDRTYIVEKLPGLGASPSVEDVLKELIRDMVKNTRSIADNTVLAAVSGYASANVGDGLVLLTKYLDGVTPPGSGFLAHELYNNLPSEVSESETMVLTCVADEPTNGRPEGEEGFSIVGQPTSGATFGWRTEGSGTSGTLNTLNSSQLLTNKDFAAWTSDVPTGWTVDAGLAGTHILEETSDAQIFRGESALKFVGDGVQATHQISQVAPLGLLTPNRMYCLSVMVKGGSNASGALTVQFESPSGAYDASSSTTGGDSEKIALTATGLDALTSYTEQHFFIIMPGTIPDDLELVIKVTGTLGNGEAVRLDSLAFGPVDYFNGVGVVVLAGATPWIQNDRIELAIANDNGGVFQDLFRRKYKVQLPSSASPTMADSLATT